MLSPTPHPKIYNKNKKNYIMMENITRTKTQGLILHLKTSAIHINFLEIYVSSLYNFAKFSVSKKGSKLMSVECKSLAFDQKFY